MKTKNHTSIKPVEENCFIGVKEKVLVLCNAIYSECEMDLIEAD